MLIDNKNLFPLSYVYPSLGGYYMDADGAIYSSKRSKTLSRLFGTNSSGVRYYTLNKSSWSGTDLLRRARGDSRFDAETKTIITAKHIGAQLPIPAVDARAHAASLELGLKAKGFMIGTVQGTALSFAKTPTIHTTEASVKSEAERLARLQPGIKFVIVKVCNVVVASSVSWE